MEDGATLETVISALELKPDRIAVEWNGHIVARARWLTTLVRSGDKLEVVHFVGGGSTSRPLKPCGECPLRASEVVRTSGKLWTAG